jgi:hypothetical protein
MKGRPIMAGLFGSIFKKGLNMKVQYLVSATGAIDISKGQIVEVSDAEGKRLIAAEIAIAAKAGKADQGQADQAPGASA